MRVVDRRTEETVVFLPSEANKDYGLFLIFVGIVAVPPAYWLYFWFKQQSFHWWASWKPCVFIMLIWVLLGIWLISFSKKTIIVGKNHIRILDGLFKKSFTIRWKGEPAIKLKYDEEERKGRIREFWETSLVDGKLEYTIDRREHHQLEARALGEVVARHLSCNFIERDEEGKETVIEPKDLDLPFRRRVNKYSRLMRKPVEAPAKTILKIEKKHKRLLVTWGIQSTGILLDIFTFAIICFIFSLLPWKEGSLSFFEQCARRGDFFVYWTAAGILLLAVLVVLGYRARFHLSPVGAIFWVTIWGIPLRKKKINMDYIEEIRLTPSVRGPRIQIISDKDIISFRLFDRAGARWLSYKLQQYMLCEQDVENAGEKGKGEEMEEGESMVSSSNEI